MRRMLPALSLALLVPASAALHAAEEPAPKTWLDHVRFHTLRTLRDLGRELDKMKVSMRTSMRDLRDGTADGLGSVTKGGRRGLDDASKAVSRAAATAYRETHDAFLAAGRTITPGVASQRETKGLAAIAGKLESPILAPHFLRGHDIVLAWHLDTGGRPIRASAVFDDRLLIETADLSLYSFEPPTGILQWLYSLPGPSQSGYAAEQNSIIVIAKDVYYELDNGVGRPRRRIVLPFPAAGPPAVLGSDVIISSWERRVIALDRETRVREWSYVPDGQVVAAAAPAPDLVYIADVSGRLVGYSVAGRQARWTYKAHDAFRVTPVLHLIDIIVPAEDLFVHCVNRFSGLCRWKYAVQGMVTRPVWIDNEVAYFSADGDALYAVACKDGKLLWRCPKGGWPVAVGRDSIYIQGAGKEIWCLDRKTGEKKWAISAEPFSHFVYNSVNDHIYLCTDRGEVYAFYLRGDHLDKKAPPVPEKEKKAPPKGKGIEEPEPGGVEPSEGEAPKPKVKMPTPRPRPPAKKKGVEPAEEEAPKAKEKEKAEEEEVAPAAKEKGAAKLPAVKSKAPEGEKTPAELDEEAEKAKKKE